MTDNTAVYLRAVVSPARQTERRRERVSMTVILLCAVLAILILPPTYFLIHFSLHAIQPNGSTGEFTFAHYYKLFSGRFFLPSLINTAVYATGSAAVALVLGILQAVLVERTNTPGRDYVFLSTI